VGRNIRILDNQIDAVSPSLIEARRIGGLEFSGNTVRFDASTASNPKIRLTACEDVMFRHNTFSRPTRIEAEASQVEAEANTGLLTTE